jgi:hypothetical protein
LLAVGCLDTKCSSHVRQCFPGTEDKKVGIVNSIAALTGPPNHLSFSA